MWYWLASKEKTYRIRKVNITMGVFFDGTKNNKYNIDFGDNIKKGWGHLTSKVKTTDSYESSYSNVAKLWDMYYVNNKGNADSIAKVYIEGSGTSSPERDWNSRFKDEEGFVSSKEGDTTGGSAFGNGQTGVNAKVERACDLICQKLSSLIRDKGAKPKGRLYFVGTGEEKKLIHSIRAEYIHLSAHRSTWPIHPHEATKDNQRIFIKG